MRSKTKRTISTPVWQISIGIALHFFVASDAWGHSGRTDSSGCHTCRTNCAKWGLSNGQYHCHGGPRSKSGGSSLSKERSSPKHNAAAGKRLSGANPSDFTWLSVRINSVIDGDTVVASVGGRQQELHLIDIDAPEMGQSFGPEAKDLLAERLLGKIIQVAVISQRPEGGLWTRAFIKAENLAEDMLEAGLAWCQRGLSHQRLQAIERASRQERKGLWAQDSPQPPWEWRQTLNNSKGGD